MEKIELVIYENIKEIEDEELCHEDEIIFKIEKEEISYVVETNYLSINGMFNDDYIFKKIRRNPTELCREAYGYEPNEQHKNEPIDEEDLPEFPEFRDYDFEAAKRLIIKIYKIIEQQKERKEIKKEILE